ncbi:hypothetical protein GF337_11275 [candidate division KSB1 bacterium]|nr:hypothetical protein [candidate division KSB1 bacterium]
MHGSEESVAIRTHETGYLPIGYLERHGDHLPMGTALHAHKISCLDGLKTLAVTFAIYESAEKERLVSVSAEFGD